MLKAILDYKSNKKLILFISYFTSVLIAVIVYLTGGTTYAYTNLMYIPISFVASTRGKKDAMLNALVSGLLVGPIMPLNVSLGLSQATTNWATRILIYETIAFIIGFLYDYGEKKKEYISTLHTLDSMTGLKNMEAFQNEAMPKLNSRTIISLTIKDYEHTNRLFGYQFSKATIIKVSELLKEAILENPNMELIRYVGMEYVIIINDDREYKPDDIIKFLEFLDKRIIVVQDIPRYLELIIGYTRIDEKTYIKEGIRQAILALRQSIFDNNKIMEYDPKFDNYYKNIVDVGANFGKALKNNNIKAAIQKIYNANTEEIVGVEMLARWIKEDTTMVPPVIFIPIIETTDLINDLTKFMIDRAIDYIRRIKGNVAASINFSSNNFNTPTVEYLLNLVKALKLDPSRIRIEITEEIIIHKKDFEYLNLLSNAGFKIAIDDFGTGYSSYKMLLDLPLDYVKIDKSLIDDIAKDKASTSLVESIVYFCKMNNIETIAEGIETREIADKCREIGIDYLQGYYYHVPEIIY